MADEKKYRHRLWTVTALGLFSVVCVVASVVHRFRSEDGVPVVEGVPVTSLTVELEQAHVDERIIGPLARNRAVAIPVLLEQMDVDDSRLKRFLARAWRALPDNAQAQFPKWKTAEELRVGASWGLRMLTDGEDSGFSGAVTRAEASLILPTLRGAMMDTNWFVRLNAAVVLGALKETPQEAVELCHLGMKDRSHSVRINIAYALSRLVKSYPEAMKEINELRMDAHPEVREKLAEYLGETVKKDEANR